MKVINWDEYFYSHYQPEKKEWGRDDLNKYRRWYKTWIPFIENTLEISFHSKKVLELGCGIGAVSTLLFDSGATVTGSDIARVMVDHAKQLSPEISFMTYDIMKPFPHPHTFDCVFAFEVLEHIPQLAVALKNIHNLLERGGWFIGSTPYPYSKNMIDPTHVNVHLPTFWKTLFISSGFSSVETYPMSFLPFFWRTPLSFPFILPFNISWKYIVSTTLIVAKKE